MGEGGGGCFATEKEKGGKEERLGDCPPASGMTGIGNQSSETENW